MPNPYLPLTDANANDDVTCPGCGGKAFSRVSCTVCDKAGVIERWVAVTITTDGEVR